MRFNMTRTFSGCSHDAMIFFLSFFLRSLRAAASAPCQIWRLSLDKQINNAEQKKQLATCSMSEEHREFSGPARQTLCLNAWLIGDVINPLQLRLPGLFKIGFCFYWCWSLVQLLINQVFFFIWWFEMIVWARDPMHSSTLILSISVSEIARLCVENFGLGDEVTLRENKSAILE